MVLLRRGKRAHAIGNAGACGHCGNAGRPGDLCPTLGGKHSGRLMADINEIDPLFSTAVIDGEEMPTGKGEELADAVRLELTRHEASAVEPGVVGSISRHGRTPTVGRW